MFKTQAASSNLFETPRGARRINAPPHKKLLVIRRVAKMKYSFCWDVMKRRCVETDVSEPIDNSSSPIILLRLLDP
jgi:hypothetical protein